MILGEGKMEAGVGLGLEGDHRRVEMRRPLSSFSLGPCFAWHISSQMGVDKLAKFWELERKGDLS